ncbi:AAA family ATPase [Vogesella indigofera]|uniref:AAA family ATPase n=1 Tax=Vogesella indigofera TaxID=45465 RepID=UPI00234D06E8|nr:AAA family ATPase [Vogesella indigofera]MDC7704817.1 AAA family ATPase [Vogesella indigofera]
MRLIGLRIRNFRTISTEQYIEFSDGVTLVGPNNCGKTNVLNAIRMFFTGNDNSLGYSREHDLTFGERSGQTTLVGIFKREAAELYPDLYQLYDELKGLLNVVDDPANGEIHLYLNFSTKSNPSYRFFPNTTRPADANGRAAYSRKERELVSLIIEKTTCHYVPSNKSFEHIYESLLAPFIRSHVSAVLQDKISEINSSLRLIANSLTESMRVAGH